MTRLFKMKVFTNKRLHLPIFHFLFNGNLHICMNVRMHIFINIHNICMYINMFGMSSFLIRNTIFFYPCKYLLCKQRCNCANICIIFCALMMFTSVFNNHIHMCALYYHGYSLVIWQNKQLLLMR